jgi:hypothetical protein
MLNKGYYYQKGFDAAFTRHLVIVKNVKTSWRRMWFNKGYVAGVIYLEGQALLNGFDDKWE